MQLTQPRRNAIRVDLIHQLSKAPGSCILRQNSKQLLSIPGDRLTEVLNSTFLSSPSLYCSYLSTNQSYLCGSQDLDEKEARPRSRPFKRLQLPLTLSFFLNQLEHSRRPPRSEHCQTTLATFSHLAPHLHDLILTNLDNRYHGRQRSKLSKPEHVCYSNTRLNRFLH